MTCPDGPLCQRARYKFIGCEILYREACLLASRCDARVDVEFLCKGLHDLETGEMVRTIQQAVDAVDADQGYRAVLLGYARCNDGLVGVRARNLPLVIPRAHDCITLFFGSRQAYQEHFDAHPGTYYMTTGWTERSDFADGAIPAYGREGVMGKLGLTDSREQLIAKYGPENAEYILQTLGDWREHYTRMLYLEMGTCDETSLIEQARRRAEEYGWQFERRDGSWVLLEKLFSGQWDDDFVLVQPGQTIVARNDGSVIEAE
jgi:hypothetical protein